MKLKLVNLLWGVSLAVIGVGSVLFSVSGIAGFPLPDLLVRILGILNLAALPVLAFSTVKKVQLSAQRVKEAAEKKLSAEQGTEEQEKK